jgi:lipoic acid synthetase
MKVATYVTPEKFAEYKERAEQMGFAYCASGPLVRSSYRAGEFFVAALLDNRPRAYDTTPPEVTAMQAAPVDGPAARAMEYAF